MNQPEKPAPRTVELVRSSYQPTQAELKEELDIEVPGDTLEEKLSFAGRALTETVNIRWIDKPRNRR